MKIIVASENPTKIEATKRAFEMSFKDENLEVLGIKTKSGVPDQPIGSAETLRGAINRLHHAKELNPDADFWIGLEGGNIIHSDTEMEAMAWMVISDGKTVGKARTAGFFLPSKTIELINQGMELGHADELVFGIQNSKQKMGSSGLLTDNLIDRTNFYIPAIIFALIPFKKPELYKN